MEHISKHLTVSKQELTNSSNVPDKTMLPEEQAIIRVKYASPCFGRIPPGEIFLVAQTLLLKLHVVTGWVIPQKELMDILIDQFALKLQESYQNVNADEMLFAFRNNPGVKDWGKAMNLNLIDEVMMPYLERRLELSRIEETKKPLMLPAPEVSDEEFIESVRKLYKIHQNYKQIPVLAYKILNMNLSREEKLKIQQHIHETTKDGDIKELCQQYAVKKYFDELERGL
jgi:hypothetical protein